MPRLRSHAQTASPSPPSSSAASPPSAIAADLLATPAPSPSTALHLGLGPAAEPPKPSAVAAPRRSLRLAGAGPATPPSSSSVSSGSEGRRGNARVSGGPAAAPKDGGLGEGAGGADVRVPVGGGGEVVFMSLRSGARIAQRTMEGGVKGSDELGIGLDGEVEQKLHSVGDEDEVHDEMLHPDVDGSVKRMKSETIKRTKLDYISDSEGEKDHRLPTEDAWNLCTQLHSAWGTVETNGVLTNMDRKDKQGRDNFEENGKVELEENSSRENDLFLNEDGGTTMKPWSFGTSEMVVPYKDMYFIEEMRRCESRKKDRGKEKLVLGDKDFRADASMGSAVGSGRQRFGLDRKGKGKMVDEESSLSLSTGKDKMDLDPVVTEDIQSISRSVGASVEQPLPEVANQMRPDWREAARKRAIKLAPKFAFFKAEEDGHSDESDEEELEPVAEPEDWPGPFSTAMKIIDDRDAKLRARVLNPFKLDKFADVGISWTPSKDRKTSIRSAPSLKTLCLQVLSNNAEGIESLEGIPDDLKHKLVVMLCCSRKMNTHILSELLHNSPSTLQLSDCSWLREDNFESVFGKCKTAGLQVLQLDLSGRCMPDYVLPTTFAKVPNSMPLLTKISLKGNYRISDDGLDRIISAAPSLSSLNLCQCSLLTSAGIENLAYKLDSVLRELYIDDCLNVEAMLILPGLKKIKHLEVLSMSGIPSVCDKFVHELIPVHGSSVKELAFAGCLKLTSSSIKIIAENCPQLSSLDICNLNHVHDSAMRHLARGCRFIRKLRLRRNPFSDKAVSQFLEESGGCLIELSLNNVDKVENLTARAIARKCSPSLQSLDLSFCRKLTNEAVGLIVDSCSSLQILKLFGCTQVTHAFLNGHSNSLVKIVGIEGNIFGQLDTY